MMNPVKIKTLVFFTACTILFACSDTKKPVLAAETIFDAKNMRVITSSFNKKLGTLSTLYGNEAALAAAGNDTGEHSSGEVFTLVSWDLAPNPFWYGGNINQALKSIETLSIHSLGENETRLDYQRQPAEDRMTVKDKQLRIHFILSQKASVFP